MKNSLYTDSQMEDDTDNPWAVRKDSTTPPPAPLVPAQQQSVSDAVYGWMNEGKAGPDPVESDTTYISQYDKPLVDGVEEGLRRTARTGDSKDYLDLVGKVRTIRQSYPHLDAHVPARASKAFDEYSKAFDAEEKAFSAGGNRSTADDRARFRGAAATKGMEAFLRTALAQATPATPKPEGPAPASGQSARQQRPVINLGADRTANIIRNEPAVFEIADNPAEDGSAPSHRIHSRGRSAVMEYGAIAEEEAKRQGVDPDLVKSILYYENADGHYFGGNAFGDMVGLSRSVAPMNIRPDKWAGLGLSRENASDPRTNIRAAVTLLKRITERIEDPTPEKIGTLWNNVRAEQVTERGARIGRAFRERQWEQQWPQEYGADDGVRRLRSGVK